MEKYAIGIDLGGRSVKFGLFTEHGELINKSNIITRTENNGENILPDTYDHLQKIIEKFDLNEENLLGIGLGIPGAITDMKLVHKAVNLGWGLVDVKEFFKDKINTKILVENDANVAALGEYWKGSASTADNIVMVTLGTGVGGGIISHGQILSGSTGAGGEIGHMPMLETPQKRTCGCGNNRCFEQVASATGLENLALDYLFENDTQSTLRDLDSIEAKDIFDAFKEEDPAAIEICKQYFNYLGRGLAIISAIVNPDIFVIGGGVSNAGQVLIDNLKEYYQKYCFVNTRNADIVLAKLGNDAGIYGAAKLVI